MKLRHAVCATLLVLGLLIAGCTTVYLDQPTPPGDLLPPTTSTGGGNP